MRAVLCFILFLLINPIAEAKQPTWQQQCQHYIQQVSNDPNLPYAIVEGITRAYALAKIEATPKVLLDTCHWAIATAQQESKLEFRIGRHGEVGMYQFLINTVRSTFRYYGLDWPNADEDVVRYLLRPVDATTIFVLHFRQLLDKHKNLRLAWKAYNAGKQSTQYANQVMSRYSKVRRIRPLVCEPGEVDVYEVRQVDWFSIANPNTRSLLVSE